MRRLFGLIATCLALAVPLSAETAEVAPNSTVTVAYTVMLANEQVVAQTKEQEPSTFVMGQGQMFPAVEEKMVGMKVGDSQTIVLEPEQAFGPVDPEAIRKVPTGELPEEVREVGKTLSVQGQEGQPIQARVVEVNDETAVLDFNHPMAGETLKFQVQVLEVK